MQRLRNGRISDFSVRLRASVFFPPAKNGAARIGSICRQGWRRSRAALRKDAGPAAEWPAGPACSPRNEG